MVGAGSCQINAIKKIKEMGHTVIAADYNLWTEGKSIADVSVLADAFDEEAIFLCASEHRVDGILTVGTDQPVFIINQVSERLKLPHFLSVQTGLWVTNKKEMKHRFSKFKIPTAPFAVVGQSFSSSALTHIKPPYVIKPIDSQGQRGIYKVDTIDEIRSHFEDVIRYSRVKEILVEQFYENDEITVSGWVTNGKLSIFTITDRITFPADSRIGVCIAHRFPSVHQNSYGEKIISLTELICNRFDIEQGPIYFQYLVGDKGIWVNEIACRLGGAYEDVTIPYVTGVDVLAHNIIQSYDKVQSFKGYAYKSDRKPFNTQLFFCKPGKLVSMTPVARLKEKPYILDAGYNFKIGDDIGRIENASQRAGYFIVTGENETEVEENIRKVYDLLYFQDESGENLIISYDAALNSI